MPKASPLNHHRCYKDDYTTTSALFDKRFIHRWPYSFWSEIKSILKLLWEGLQGLHEDILRYPCDRGSPPSVLVHETWKIPFGMADTLKRYCGHDCWNLLSSTLLSSSGSTVIINSSKIMPLSKRLTISTYTETVWWQQIHLKKLCSSPL